MRTIFVRKAKAASLCIFGLAACGGVSERTVTERKNQTASAGAPNQGGARSSSAATSGSAYAGSGAAGEYGGAAAITAIPNAAGASGTSALCPNGPRFCKGKTVMLCVNGNLTVAPNEEQCGGTTPLCVGAGVCSPFRLAAGTIDTFGEHVEPLTKPGFRLKRETLLYGYAFDSTGTRICGGTTTRFCVTGGITPSGEKAEGGSP